MLYIYYKGVLTTYNDYTWNDELSKYKTNDSLILTLEDYHMGYGFNIYIGTDVILHYYSGPNDNFKHVCRAYINSLRCYHDYGLIINDFIVSHSANIMDLNINTFDIIVNKVLATFPLYMEMFNNFKKSIMCINIKSAVKK